MLVATLAQFLDQHEVAGGALLVGVSGGADSVALLCGLLQLSRSQQLQQLIVHVAHFDHALRLDSGEDAQWVQQLCASLQVPVHVERRSGSDFDRNPAAEETARRMRYAFLKRVAADIGARWIAVAHTADDQAETVLHHIVRGSGLKGLNGIPATRSLGDSLQLIRPLLQVSRSEVLWFLESQSQLFRTDSTNSSGQYTRNRIRNDVLPMLRSELNPKVDDALRRLAQQSTDVQHALEQLAGELLARSLLAQDDVMLKLDRSELETRPVALLRELFSQIWQLRNWSRQGMGFTHFEQLAEMARTGLHVKICLPGGIVAACRGKLLELQKPENS